VEVEVSGGMAGECIGKRRNCLRFLATVALVSAPRTESRHPERPLRRDAERNRERILAAAADAFAGGGLAVTMDEIARRAGVGVGTVYRRFPDKELLIEALFEQRIDELVGLAEAARDHPDAFEGLVQFFETFLAVQAADRGLKEVLIGTGRGQRRVVEARSRIAPVVDELVERARAAGGLRPDVTSSDLGLIQFMLGAAIDYTHDVDPEAWRRLLAIVLDGLRRRRDAPTPLPTPALDVDQLDRAMAAWRQPRR
jgi:AcrR family transcriptional regulator